ncbi:hypothetical protein EVG20_g5820 [Dentipellis fragilis]|uniref:Geranylgeranyl pyrophosphate synthetase n=1 Tax=Dentipellis fragilis TaxID=205917 RepID=A0A4Y9YSX8_9AGAM|nr:hypothetical protein EVG20_g5820 [Dentipellis fragilis]
MSLLRLRASHNGEVHGVQSKHAAAASQTGMERWSIQRNIPQDMVPYDQAISDPYRAFSCKYWKPKQHQKQSCDLLEGLISFRPPIKTLFASDILPGDVSTDINNAEHVGSYNSTREREPTIIVPGSPPEWIDHPVPFTLEPDSKSRLLGENPHCKTGTPLLSLMKAVDAAGTAVDWRSIDVVTDRNILRRLMRWLVQSHQPKDFRIDIELGGDHTLLMNKCGPNVLLKHSKDARCFGFGFEGATTRNVEGCERSTGHYRIIKYECLGLSMIVRYEVDAYLPSAVPTVAKGSSISANKQFSPTTIASKSTVDTLNIIHAGREIPQSSIIEITTRSPRTRRQRAELAPRLYLSQTPFLYIGMHKDGKSWEMRKKNVAEDIQMKHKEVETLQKLGQVLKVIRGIMVENSGKKLSVICEGETLKIYERIAKKSCLPEEVMKRFDVA